METLRITRLKFNEMYGGQEITDPLGNIVSFGPKDCLHVCYHGTSRSGEIPSTGETNPRDKSPGYD